MNTISLTNKKLKVAIVLACFATTLSVASDVSAAKLLTPERDAAKAAAQLKKEQDILEQQRMAEIAKRKAQSMQPAPQLQSPEAYYGLPVLSVSVSGTKVLQAEEIAKVSTLKKGDKLDRAALEADLQAIYASGWFYDIHPEFRQVPEGVEVIYAVQENPVFNKLEIEGNHVYKNADILKMLALEKGKMLNTAVLNENLRTLETKYKNDGYIMARIGDLDILKDGTLHIVISEGILEGFDIQGNNKTKEHVITREMRTKVGQPFNAKLAKRSLERLYNLGFFEDINVKLNPGRTPGGVVMQLIVSETNTGEIRVGGGYSSTDGLVGILGLGDKNFRGSGDSVNINWQIGGRHKKNYNFSYVKPWFDKKETTASLAIYDTTQEYQDYFDDGSDKARYDRQAKGWNVGFSRPLSEYWRGSIYLKNRKDEYKGKIEGYVPQYYEQHPDRKVEDFGITRSVTLGRSLDTRNNIYDANKGRKIEFSTEIAGFGGNFSFKKYNLSSNWYYSTKKAPNNVLALRFALGYATGVMPVSQRFALGGAENLRGYKDDYFKGYKMLNATAEYRYPIIKKIQGVVFADTGFAWEKNPDGTLPLSKNTSYNFKDLRWGYGVGLRIATPVGPVRLDVAKGDRVRWHFSFGGNF